MARKKRNPSRDIEFKACSGCFDYENGFPVWDTRFGIAWEKIWSNFKYSHVAWEKTDRVEDRCTCDICGVRNFNYFHNGTLVFID